MHAAKGDISLSCFHSNCDAKSSNSINASDLCSDDRLKEVRENMGYWDMLEMKALKHKFRHPRSGTGDQFRWRRRSQSGYRIFHPTNFVIGDREAWIPHLRFARAG
jgi:hypothetical protein